MTTLKAYGTLLAASDESRTLTYRLLPFGEMGRTNLGGVTVAKGVLTLPDNPGSMSANLEHDRTRPVAKFTEVREADTGLEADLHVLPTTAGNDLLIEAREGVRTGISVEIDDPVIRDGEMKAGVLTGAGFVTQPAFDSARLVACEDLGGDAEAEAEDVDTEDDQTTEPTEGSDNAASAAGSEGTVPENDTAAEKVAVTENAPMKAAQAPQGIPASKGGTLEFKSADDLFTRLAAAHASMDGGRMLAALDEAVQADVQPAQQPTWLGEVWSSRTHRQKYVPLFTRAPLTSMKMTGWEFDGTTADPDIPATPTVGPYAGFPAEPTSTEVKTRAVEIAAHRLAGANAIDRAFVDFSSPEFWRGYYREAANDLSRKIDASAGVHLMQPGNYAPVTAETVPTGVATALSYILDGVMAIQDLAVPDFAVVGNDLWRELALTRREDAVEYLSVAVGLDPAEGRLDSFKIVPSADASVVGKVLVGASEAHTFYGEKSVRVDTVNVSTGGVETGLFAYVAEHTANPNAFALVAPAAP